MMNRGEHHEEDPVRRPRRVLRLLGGCGGGSAPIKNKTPPDLASEIIVPE